MGRWCRLVHQAFEAAIMSSGGRVHTCVVSRMDFRDVQGVGWQRNMRRITTRLTWYRRGCGLSDDALETQGCRPEFKDLSPHTYVIVSVVS